jgi:PqqD family protein of HPr-rel-A system
METTRLSTLAISDTGFVFDPRTGHSYTVNTTGLVALRALKGGSSLAEVRQSVESAFDCPASVATDVQNFLESLATFDLVGARRASSEAL